MGSLHFCRRTFILFQVSNMFDFCPHPQGVRPETKGFSHGLKTVHRTVFLTAFRIPPLIDEI